MAKKVFTDESLKTLVDETKLYTETVASGKANAVHTHAISDVTGLQSALDGKAASSHGTHVTYSTTAPVMDGTASAGSASTVARSDHKHPTDTSRASKTEFDTHNSDTTKHITSTERTNWNAAKTHADSAHAPSDAQKNQNAFSNIAVSGQTTVAADTATDTVTFVGSNVTITTDATNDKVTFSVADGSTSGKGVVQLTNSTSSTSTTTAATPSSVKSAYDLANTAKTNAATAQSKADSAYSLAESKVDSLSDLGVTATATELNYVDGVTSNIQTQLDGKLSTSGGTISGAITTTDGDAFNRNVTTGGTYYYGGTGFDDGAFLGLYGKDQSNYAGQFRLKADNGESFAYLEGMPDGQLRWNNKTVATLNSSGAIPIADGGTGARSSSGALANLGGVPLAGGEMTGALKLPKLSATSTDAYIGSMTVPFQQVYTKNVYIQDGKNDTVSYGDFRAQTTGTASVVGKAQLDVGNSTKTGTAGNARGIVRVYGTGAYYHQIQGDATANRTLTLPNKNGTLATTDDVSTTKALTTAEYTELEQAGEINANTLYMLTDSEEENQISLDTTLSVEGKAADAKAVGDALAEKQPKGNYLTSYTETDPTVPAWAKASKKPSYTASEVGADASGTAESLVNAHNVDTSVHADIREEIEKLSENKADTEYVDSEIADLKVQGVQQVPLFVNTIEECTDTSKFYVLPDGYIYAYMMTEVKEEVIAYTNRLPLSVDSNGNAYNGGKGWKADTRLNSSGVEASYTGIECTGFIPVKRGDILRFKNFGFVPDGEYKSQQYTSVYDSNKTKLVSFISNVISGTYSNYGGVERDEAGNMILLKTDAIPIDGSAAQSEHEAFAFPENTAFVRFSAEEITDATIITVNEEIAATAATTKESAWANTGHAFVPADYEDRIIAVEATAEANKESVESHEARIADLERGAVAGIPNYVIAEAEEVIDKVISAQGNRTFTFAAITDMHYGNGGYDDGVVHACHAMKYIDSRIKLDAVVVLGDYTDGLAVNAFEGAASDCKEINAVLDGLRFAPNIRLQGNHDFYAKHSPVTHRYIQAYSDDVVWGSRLGGYFYRDFEDFKLRVICLNTAEENKDGVSCTAEQYSWFATALDLSSKATSADWQTLILSHHPLDWFTSNDSGYVFWQILNAYLNGTSWNGHNFAGKNSAKIVGNVHGHIHNLLTRKIAAGQPNTTESTINVVRIATPEACYGRPNSYNGSWEYNPFGEATSYPKTHGTAEDTAFCIYCIDLDTHTIKAICYGAGYDRAINY